MAERRAPDLIARVRAAGGAVARQALADGGEALLFRPRGVPARAVALLHGGGNDRTYGLWATIEGLVARDLLVAVADLPGHGMGGGDRFSVAAARTRVDALVEAAALAAGGRVAVVGQSLGGAFALDRRARGGAEPVVAVSVPLALDLGPAVVGEVATLLRAETWRALRGVPWRDAMPALGPFNRARYPVRLAGPGGYLDAFRGALAELDLERRLAAGPAAAPVLVVQGERDAIAPPAHGRRLLAAIGPAAGWLPVPGGRHFDPLLRDEVVAMIAGWLTRARGPAQMATF